MAAGKVISVVILGLVVSGCSTFTARDIDTLPPTAALPVSSEPGVVELRYFNDIPVTSINDIPVLSRYPDNPDEIVRIDRLEVLNSRADTYGSLVRGYIVPLKSGDFRFFVSGDDEAQFLFSKSSSAAEVELIASVPAYSTRNQFDKYSSQKSAIFNLTAGKKYYFEIRHREAYGGDHFSVAWEGPGFTRSIITAEYLVSLGQESQLYSNEEIAVRSYGLGYRVGFFDGLNEMAYSPLYPPLDENQDGLYDNWVTYFGMDASASNVANRDQDGDLLSSFDEFWLGTSPNNFDTDGDGISDGEEFAFGLNALDPADAANDSDGDGFSNLAESEAGTDMTNPEDKPKPVFVLEQGVIGQYYEGSNFDTFVLLRREQSVNFDWGGGSPAPGLSKDRFTIRWVGYLTPSHEDGERNYEFRIKRDDGARLFVNGELALNAWVGAVYRTFSSEISLPAGEPIPFTLEFKEGFGNASVNVEVIDSITGKAQDLSGFFKTEKLDSDSVIDTDSDGIPDIWEARYGLNPAKVDSSQIINLDGITNLDAYQSGLDPRTLEKASTSISNSGNSAPPVTETKVITLFWTAPLTRVDGSSISLSEISSYEIEYGRALDKLTNIVKVSSENTSHIFTELTKGQWFFNVQAVDQKGLHSIPSETIKYTVK